MTKPISKQYFDTDPKNLSNHGSDQSTVRLTVLAGSVRKERQSRVLAEWVVSLIPTQTASVDLIDLAECVLPDDELLQPGGGVKTEISDRIAAADGFVIVTPEYNHSYTADLKRFIDWHYDEWQFKAATVVSYGVQGGLLATEHLRGVFAELYVVTTRRMVGLRAPWQAIDETGYSPEPGISSAVQAAVDELSWWAETLRRARYDRPYQA